MLGSFQEEAPEGCSWAKKTSVSVNDTPWQRNAGGLNCLPLLAIPSFQLGQEHLKIFLSFLKVGAILYGSGYVLFAYLDAELVGTGLLSRAELIDAIAVGQFTPGPVLSTATFIGYQLGGLGGASSASFTNENLVRFTAADWIIN